MSMLEIAIVPAAMGAVIAICRVIDHWRTSGVVERTTKLAIEGCPAEKRPEVLRASAVLADRLRAESPQASPTTRPKLK
jgi:hypothetical protein